MVCRKSGREEGFPRGFKYFVAQVEAGSVPAIFQKFSLERFQHSNE